MKKFISLVLSAVLLGSAMLSCSKKEDDLLTYKYNYDLSQYIDLAPYKNLPAEGYRISVTDEAVEQQILMSRAYYARLTDVTDRGAVYGDTLYIDYVATVNGEEFDGSSETDCEVVIGGGEFFEDFENALIGAYPETSLSLDLTFPDPYLRAPEHAGEDVHFDVTVHEICETELPDYTDDFVRAYLGYGSCEEYEQSVRESLLDYYTDIYYQYVSNQVWSSVLENTTVKQWPEEEITQMTDDMVGAVEAYSEMLGMTMTAYLNLYYDTTEEEFIASCREDAETQIKEEMVAYAIARAENLTLSDAEYTTRATEYAVDYYELASLEAFEALYDKSLIRQTIMIDKVIELVVDSADVTFLD